MSIPDRAASAALLVALRPNDGIRRHSAAVADVAAFLADAIRRRGTAVDRALVESAALLHDVDKVLPADHAHASLGHGDAGAAWLRDHGHAELSAAVAGHPVTRLAEDERYVVWWRDASLEERVVAYADKRAAQRLGSLDERFARWYQRHPERREALDVARTRARLLEEQVCAAAGVAPDEVDRLPWADAALAAAEERWTEPARREDTG
jgi:putative nucleotidyltransferase with HDIG domain